MGERAGVRTVLQAARRERGRARAAGRAGTRSARAGPEQPRRGRERLHRFRAQHLLGPSAARAGPSLPMKPPAAQSSPAAAAAAGECGTPKALAPRAWWGGERRGIQGRPFPAGPHPPLRDPAPGGFSCLPRAWLGPLNGRSLTPSCHRLPVRTRPRGTIVGTSTLQRVGKSSAAWISWVTFGLQLHSAEAQFPHL